MFFILHELISPHEVSGSVSAVVLSLRTHHQTLLFLLVFSTDQSSSPGAKNHSTGLSTSDSAKSSYFKHPYSVVQKFTISCSSADHQDVWKKKNYWQVQPSEAFQFWYTKIWYLVTEQSNVDQVRPDKLVYRTVMLLLHNETCIFTQASDNCWSRRIWNHFWFWVSASDDDKYSWLLLYLPSYPIKQSIDFTKSGDWL